MDVLPSEDWNNGKVYPQVHLDECSLYQNLNTMFCPVHSCVYSPEWGQASQFFSVSQLLLQTHWHCPAIQFIHPSPPTLSTLLYCFQQPTNVITSVKNDKNMVHIYNFREVETKGPGRSQCWCQCYTESWRPAWATLDSVSKNKSTIPIIIETTKKNPDLSLPDYAFIPFHPLPFLLSFLC